MIKNIFIPQQIGSFYIFTVRTVGIEVGSTEILAAVVSAHGTRKEIQQLIKEPISQDGNIDYQKRAAQALKSLMAKIGHYTNLVASLPSESVIFKEVSVPLMSLHKMKMIVPFEIESLLPFPLEQAAIDSIIISTDKPANKAHLFVAAVKQDVLQKFLDLFNEAQLPPPRLTTDVFELYGLYHSIAQYQKNEQPTLLLHIDSTTTQALFLVNNQIKAIRVIPGGFNHHEQGSLVQLDNDQFSQALNPFFNDISLTIENFLTKLSMSSRLEKIVLCGPTTEIKGFQERIASYFGVPCELLTLNRVLHNGSVISKNALSNEFVIPLATALSSPQTEWVNFNRQAMEEASGSIIDKQLISTFALVVFILGSLLFNSILTKRSLQKEIQSSEEEAIGLLTKQLNLNLLKGKLSLEQINARARSSVDEKESIWFALSSSNRFSFLAYLQDLNTRINRTALGLDLRQLTISDSTNTMTLEGQVKNFEALRALEEDLNQSKMFKNVSKPQDLKFTITIALEKPYGE